MRPLSGLLRRLQPEQGATLVEFALSCAVLFMTLFGIFELSIALYSYNFVADAAHEATRYALVRGSACTGFTDCNIKTSTPIQTYVRGLGYPGINPNNLTAAATWSGPTTSPINAPGNMVSVTVTYTYPLNIPFWPQSGSILHLSNTSQMTISQ
jgi:Flp pilus assembly protein TadG